MFAPFFDFQSCFIELFKPASFFNLVHFIKEMKLSDEQRNLIILKFAKRLSAIAVKRKFF